MPLPQAHLLDELATAYVQAVAAAAGATIAVSRLDYGVDGTLKHIIRAEGDRYIESGFPVDFQLKGTTTTEFATGHASYDLRARNYDLIVARAETATPYYLFLVCFESDAEKWVVQNTDSLVLRASAFWWTHFGPPTANTASVRVEIPIANRLTSGAIEGMLQASKERFV